MKPPQVNLTLRLYEGDGKTENTRYLVRDVPMWHLPAEGDQLAVTPGGTLMTVASRQWNFQGEAVIRLREVIVDPADPADDTVSDRALVWNTEQEGRSLLCLLVDSGWERLA